jgi:macrolide transport system ATP-binding/permease protein
MIEAQGLTKLYPTPRGEQIALAEVSLSIQAGEFVAIRGHSGSGKSTLLGILGGLCKPTRGTVQIDGLDLGNLSPRQLADFRGRKIGFIFQFPSLLHNLRAIDNVALPALIRGDFDYAAAYDSARRGLAEVGLGKRWDAYPAELSGGQQRRVSIARALINRPALLLADEPTSDLDVEQERETFSLLLQLQKERGSTLILVTHNPDLARQAERVIHLGRGRIVGEASGTPADERRMERASAPLNSPVIAAGPDSLAAIQTAPMGTGLGRFALDFAGWALAGLAGIVLANYLTAAWQRKELVAKSEIRRAVEEAALQKLRADVENVVAEKGNSFRVSVYLQNSDPESALYVMGPSLRAFVQVDGAWQAAGISALAQREGMVNKIDNKRLFEFTLHADFKKFDELLHGYMHVRITNSMVVADNPAPGSNLFDRTDDYYFYLRPNGISEDTIRQANHWKAGGLVPRWIPMPAH